VIIILDLITFSFCFGQAHEGVCEPIQGLKLNGLPATTAVLNAYKLNKRCACNTYLYFYEESGTYVSSWGNFRIFVTTRNCLAGNAEKSFICAVITFP